MEKKKTAALMVSFGTSHRDTLARTIEAIEADCSRAFPHVEMRRAFTSGMIMKVLKNRDGIHIENVEEAVARLVADGYRRLVLQPTHILNGEEYEKMVEQAKQFEALLERLEIGAPLLTSSRDYEDLCHAMAAYLNRYVAGSEGPEEDAHAKNEMALVLMGHGTDHFSDAAYAALEYRFHALGYRNVFVGTVEGYPDFWVMLERIKAFRPKKCILFPLMVVAGEHAKNDMAGEENSWRVWLEEAGYETECILEGMGEIPAVRHMYVTHLREAMAQLP